MSECNDRDFAVLPRIRKGIREELRVGIGYWQDHEYATIRVWSQGDREMLPTKTGINIQRNEVIDVLRGLEAAARELGLLPPDDGTGSTVPAPKPPELPATEWRGYGGLGRRRVELSEALKSAAFEMLAPKVRLSDGENG